MATEIEKEKIRKKNKTTYIILGIVAFVFYALAFLHTRALMNIDKRMSAMEAFNKGISNIILQPLNIFKCTPNDFVLMITTGAMIGALIGMALITKALRKHDNPDTVNGEAHLMNIAELKQYNLKFAAPLGKAEINGFNNMIISKDLRLAIDNRGTRRNCNILVIGGSGAGKSRFFAAPNILQYNANFVITDPSGEMLRDYGKALENNGYKVKVFNLTDTRRSNKYNPFHYIKEEQDVFILVNTLIKNTTPSEGHSGDPFWEKSETLLLTALILLLYHRAEPEKQNFASVVKLINMAEVDENDPTATSDLDQLFKEVEEIEPENLAVQQYQTFKQGAGKTLKSILISVGVRLQSFKLSNMQRLTESDDFEFESFADTKQALFVITPTADSTFSFLVSLLYSQLFSTLYKYCETTSEFGWKAQLDDYNIIKVAQASNAKESATAKKEIETFINNIKTSGITIDKGITDVEKRKNLYYIRVKKTGEIVGWRGSKEAASEFASKLDTLKIKKCDERCSNHVRLILDEFANIGEIPDFDQKLATMRKYEISCSIILQALSQLKVMYKDKWNTISGNCDTKLFLGCDDTETIEWMLKMLGKKTTIVENTSWQNKGGSTSYNRSSIELLTIDQISMMQDDECLVRIRGVRPFYGKKFELTEHPNYNSAISTKGQFYIPENEGSNVDTNIPLRVRLAEKKKEEELKTNSNINSKPAGDADAKKENKTKDEIKDSKPAVSTSVVQETNKPMDITPELPNYGPDNPYVPEGESAITEFTKIQNAARKNEAKKAEKAIKEAEEDDGFALTYDMLVNAFGVEETMNLETIKERVETMLVLEDVADGEITYSATE